MDLVRWDVQILVELLF